MTMPVTPLESLRTRSPCLRRLSAHPGHDEGRQYARQSPHPGRGVRGPSTDQSRRPPTPLWRRERRNFRPDEPHADHDGPAARDHLWSGFDRRPGGCEGCKRPRARLPGSRRHGCGRRWRSAARRTVRADDRPARRRAHGVDSRRARAEHGFDAALRIKHKAWRRAPDRTAPRLANKPSRAAGVRSGGSGSAPIRGRRTVGVLLTQRHGRRGAGETRADNHVHHWPSRFDVEDVILDPERDRSPPAEPLAAQELSPVRTSNSDPWQVCT